MFLLTPSSTATTAPASAVPAWFRTVPDKVTVAGVGVGVGVGAGVGVGVAGVVLSLQATETAAITTAAITRVHRIGTPSDAGRRKQARARANGSMPRDA